MNREAYKVLGLIFEYRNEMLKDGREPKAIIMPRHDIDMLGRDLSESVTAEPVDRIYGIDVYAAEDVIVL